MSDLISLLDWNARPEELTLLVYMNVSDNRPDYSDRLSDLENVVKSSIRKQGCWTRFSIMLDNEVIEGAIFLKRMVLSVRPSGPDYSRIPLSALLNWMILKRDFLIQLAQQLCKQLARESLIEVRSFPVTWCDRLHIGDKKIGPWQQVSGLKNHKTQLGWLDDGQTTFYMRAYDSMTETLGFIRISRHFGVFYGLSGELKQDVVNLIYEIFLYVKHPISAREVFALLDALGKYVLPSNLSIFLHHIAVKLAIFAIAATILISVFQEVKNLLLQGTNNLIWTVVCYFTFYVLLVFSLWGVWKILGKLHAIKKLFSKGHRRP